MDVCLFVLLFKGILETVLSQKVCLESFPLLNNKKLHSYLSLLLYINKFKVEKQAFIQVLSCYLYIMNFIFLRNSNITILHLIIS